MASPPRLIQTRFAEDLADILHEEELEEVRSWDLDTQKYVRALFMRFYIAGHTRREIDGSGEDR